MRARALAKDRFCASSSVSVAIFDLGSVNHGFTIIKQLEQLAWLKCTGTGRDYKFFKIAVWDLHAPLRPASGCYTEVAWRLIVH